MRRWNVSVRIAADRLLVTPSGIAKIEVGPTDLVEVSPDGSHLAGRRRASSEIKVHLRINRCRPDVMAVAHAHPPTASGFAVAGEDFMSPVLPELIYHMGQVPLIPHATPGTEELADRFEPFVGAFDAFLIVQG